MASASQMRLAGFALALVAIGGAIALGVWVRAADPLSSPVMPAEDPFTHMQLVRAHLQSGDVAYAEGYANYPPGLHAFLAAWWLFAGPSLYELVRFAPVLFGGIGLLGIAAIVGKREGLLAAFGATLAFAAMPEEIFRSGMMSPTALDLALLPVFLGALLEVARGRLAWLAAAVPLAAFFLVAHPWVLAVVLLTGLLFLTLAVTLPWSRARGTPLQGRGVLAVGGLVVGGFLLAAATRWESGGSGFGELGAPLLRHLGGPAGVVLAALAWTAVALAIVVTRRLREGKPALMTLPRWARGAAGVVFLAGFVGAVVLASLRGGMPDFVDLPRMVGWPILAVAFIGLLCVPFEGSPLAHAGAALFLATLPFVLLNPLDSPFWPHRTVAFMGIGLALLCGIALRRVAEGLQRVAPALGFGSRGKTALVAPHPGRTTAAVVLPALLLAPLFAGAVLAATPEPYPGGWYRLYTPCEFDALRDVADLADATGNGTVITGSWQSQLVLSAFVTTVPNIWNLPSFFERDFGDRGAWLDDQWLWHKPTFVLVDRHLSESVASPDLHFLEEAPWVKVREGCPSQGIMTQRFALYQLEGAG